MDIHDLTQSVAERRASREADAENHRLAKHGDVPAAKQPRLRYERRHRNPVAPRQSPTGR